MRQWMFKYILFLISAILLVSTCSAVPHLPMVISGSVYINGAQAPVGTEIKAVIGNEIKGSTTVSHIGIYGMVIEHGEGAIDFYVSGIKAQSTNWSSTPLTFNLSVYQPPPIPNTFYGTVKLNSSDAPAGTKISALIDNATKGSTTVINAGRYTLDVSGTSEDDGKNISFRVSNISAEQKAVFNASGPPPLTLNLIVGADVLAYYRGLGSRPDKVETTDLLRAADDWSRDITPLGFGAPITTLQLLRLADEWVES